MNDAEYLRLFEFGVHTLFNEFGHRLAREVTLQGWLMHCVSRVIDPQLVIAELNAPNRDLSPHADIRLTGGALSFDFAITRSQIDLRTWKSRTPGWNRGVPTTPQTLETLSDVVVLAELKVMDSKSTTAKKIMEDIQKMLAVIRFLKHHHVNDLPTCLMIIFDPNRILTDRMVDQFRSFIWPEGAPELRVLVGP